MSTDPKIADAFGHAVELPPFSAEAVQVGICDNGNVVVRLIDSSLRFHELTFGRSQQACRFFTPLPAIEDRSWVDAPVIVLPPS